MAVQQRTYDSDDLWQIVCDADDDKHYELIEGEIIEMSPPGEEHGSLAAEIARHIGNFAASRALGRLTVETGYHPPDDRLTLLAPAVAFTGRERLSQAVSKKWVPLMPDLAVEVQSPSNTLAELRQKAAIYLQHGSQLVWIVIPDKKDVEVCRLDAARQIQTEFVGADGRLSGEQIVPGFSLELTDR